MWICPVHAEPVHTEQPFLAIIQAFILKVANKPKARLISLFDCIKEYLHFHTLALGEAGNLLAKIP